MTGQLLGSDNLPTPKFEFKWICEGIPRDTHQSNCKNDPFIEVEVTAKKAGLDLTTGRKINGRYDRRKSGATFLDIGGYPSYQNSHGLRIWYSTMEESCHEGRCLTEFHLNSHAVLKRFILAQIVYFDLDRKIARIPKSREFSS